MSNTKKPKLSIVIPAYNSEKYIGRCINSVLCSTFSNFEIVIVDDGSTDKTAQIINSYRDERVRVFHQKNQGVARARNFGIKNSRGKYIMFIDNDDYIDKTYLYSYIRAIEKNDSDIVVGGYERVDTSGKILVKVTLKEDQWSKYRLVAPWAKIYKLDFLKKNYIEFLDSNIGEDIYFNIRAMVLSKKVSILKNCGYKWFYNEASISNTIHKKISSDLNFSYLLDRCWNDVGKDIILKNDFLIFFFIKTVCWYVYYIAKQNNIDDVLSERKKTFAWLDTHIPKWKSKVRLKFPAGESIKTRLGILLLTKIENAKLLKLLLKYN